MKHHILLCLFVSTMLAACSDTADKEGEGTGDPDCLPGEVANPITGLCEPRQMTPPVTPDAGSPGPEDASAPDDQGMSTDDASTPEPDLSSTCEGLERRCNGDTVEQCVQGMFEVAETCESGFVCNRGNCIPESDSTCTPGQTRCGGTALVQTCEDDGVTWSAPVMCPSGQTCSDGVCTSGCAGLLNEKSNVGCEYVTMRHNQRTGLQTLPHTVVVSNPDAQESVTIAVTSPAGINHGIAQQTIAPMDSAVLNFPTSPMINQNGLSSNIYLIRSSRPVIATQFSPLNNPGIGSETSDASLLVPTNAIGNEYVVVGWRAAEPGGTYVDIVALEPGTSVTVESPIPLSGGASGNVAANSSATFTIPENQVLHLTENRSLFDTGTRDVSGVAITANKPVAVFTGASIVNIPDEPVLENPPQGCAGENASCVSNADCCSGVCGYDLMAGTERCFDSLMAGDHVEQQLFPVESWGTTYIATAFQSRTSNDFSIYRVVAATDGTTVTLDPPVNGESSFTLNRGEMRQLHAAQAFELTASEPVMLAQFMIGGQISFTGDGDPAFLIPPAIEQYRDTYVFLVPGNYRRNFVTLVKEAGSQIVLDGAPVQQALFTPVGGSSTWEYAIIESVSAGVHSATSGSPFGVVVHGMDEYISYAYCGGITLPE